MSLFDYTNPKENTMIYLNTNNELFYCLSACKTQVLFADQLESAFTLSSFSVGSFLSEVQSGVVFKYVSAVQSHEEEEEDEYSLYLMPHTGAVYRVNDTDNCVELLVGAKDWCYTEFDYKVIEACYDNGILVSIGE